MKRAATLLSLFVFFVIIGSAPLKPMGQDAQEGQKQIVKNQIKK